MDHKVSKDMISSGMTPSGEKAQEDLGRTQYGSNPSRNTLADAYKSMYEKKEEVINEHHQKDKDGNTIPHEGEENLDEAIVTGSVLAGLAAKKLAAGLIAKKVGAVALKKGIGAAAKTGAKLTSKYIAQKGGKMAAAKAVTGEAGKGLVKGAGFVGKQAMKRPVETAIDASTMKPGPKMPKAPMDLRQKMTGARTAGMYASADLFDIVKGQLLDEGIDEKDAMKIMVELSQQDLDIIINEGLAGNVARLTAAGTVAAMGLNAINKMRQNKKKMEGGGKFTPGSTMDNIQRKNQALRDAQNM